MSNTDANTYKVGRVLEQYELNTLKNKLPSLWLGEATETEPTSLRSLAKMINVALLNKAMEEAGKDPLEGEAENAYRLLTDDDVSAGIRTQQRNRLERIGVDTDKVKSDFVTHQAVYTYLTEGLGVSKKSGDGTDPVEKHRQRINRLRNRTVAVVENSLGDLVAKDHISLGSADVILDIQVYCDGCDAQFELSELLEDNSCNCQ